MKQDEVVKLLMMIQAAYPNYKPQDKNIAMNMWYEMLKDYDANAVLAAFKAYVVSDTSGFAPSIGQIIGKLNLVLNESTDMDALEAWALVSKALRNGYYGAEAEYERLPELVRKAVGSPMNLRNWSQTDIKSIENVVMSQFISSYKTVQKRSQELSAVPVGMRMEMKERMLLNAE